MVSIAARNLSGEVLEGVLPVTTAPPFTSVGVASGGGLNVELVGAPDVMGSAWAYTGMNALLDEEYSLAGGTLRIGVANTYSDTYQLTGTVNVAVWEGVSSSLSAAVHNSSSGALQFIFTGAGINEEPDGIELTGGSVVYGEHPVMVFDVGNALFEVEPLGAGAISQLLPAWEGAKVNGMQLYAPAGASMTSLATEEEEEEQQFLLVEGETFAARVVGLDTTGDELVDLVAEITLEFV